MDADAERNAPVRCRGDIAIDHPSLHLDGALYRLRRAGELHEQTVAGRSYDTAVMLRNLGIYDLMAMRLQPFERALLVRRDQARVAYHISSEHHDKTAGIRHCCTTPRSRSGVA